MEKILFISYQFPPMGGAGVQRSTRFVSYLRDFNYDPVVFTIDEESIAKLGATTDKSLLKYIPESIRIIRTSAAKSIGFINGLMKWKLYRLFWYFFYPFFWEKSVLWSLSSVKQAKQIVKQEQIRLVYTSSAPFSAMIIGLRLKRSLGIRWVADLRDPFTDAYAWTFPSRIHWYFSRKVERWLLRKPDLLIVNTEEVKRLYINRYKLQESQIQVITNGF